MTKLLSINILLAILLFALPAPCRAQERVTLDARMTEGGIPVWMVSVTCDKLDSTFDVYPDTATGHFRLVVPRGRCLLHSIGDEEIILDLQSDTTLDLQAKFHYGYSRIDHLFRSRQQKDSTFHARETALLADLDGWDSSYWQPKLVSLLDLYQADLYYPLPRWRTFDLHTIYNYMVYCYFKNSDKYDYLYYPICQLEQRLGLKHNRRLRKPEGADGGWYVPMPEVKEDWLTDTLTCHSCLLANAKKESDYLKKEFAPQGEPSMVYPHRKKPAVRLLVYGGLSDFTALRVEDGRFYYCTSDKPWEIDEARHRERWSVKLTRGELDTLWRCVDTLLTAGDESVLNINYAIDAPNIEFEYSDRDGYRNYVCANPKKHPLTAPLDKYLDTLWRRNVCLLKVPIHDAANGKEISTATITLEGKNYHHVGSSGYINGPRFYVPKGKYTLRIECIGYEPYERKLDIQGDLTLDTIRLQHKRITLRARLHTDWGGKLTGPVALYVDGVDTAMIDTIDIMNQTVEFHNVPAANFCFFVETTEHVGGWHHSMTYPIGDSLITLDSLKTDDGIVGVVTMRLDRSRQPFRSRAEKDSTLRADVRHMELSGIYMGAEEGAIYYYDALLRLMPLWQTFPDADSLAYDELRYAYRHNPQEYNYLYYPIQHLDRLSWKLKEDTSIHHPVTDSTCYEPMPEQLLEKHRYSYVDLLTPFEETQRLNERLRKWLPSMQEYSLAFPQRERPAMRWMILPHHGSDVYVYRIDGDTLYDKHLYNPLDLTDPFDTTVDPYLPWPDTVEVRKMALSTADLKTLTQLLEALDTAGYHNYAGPNPEGHPSLSYHRFEYVLEGRYHSFYSHLPYELPLVKALMEWLESLSHR